MCYGPLILPLGSAETSKTSNALMKQVFACMTASDLNSSSEAKPSCSRT